jgi:hypothetical protein
MELVFTRPEIGTIVLLSGDSDFSSLVIKLKEYGKYVIGVGIRESSSDLLVQNCDEYYSYNALAGLVRAGEEPVTKWDPWELVSEAIARMKRNGDVMRADRLKQVMQEIDSSFDEKNLSMSKFSRFVTEAAQRGLLHVSKLDNGQLEVDLPRPPMEQAAPAVSSAPLPRSESAPARPATARPSGDTAPERPAGRGLRGTRSARGRGRAMRGEPAPLEQPVEAAQSTTPAVESVAPARPAAAPPAAPPSAGERLTRSEAFDLLQRSVNQLTDGGMRTIPAARLREKARELLGRDSDTLSERYFSRILQDAHDADIIDVRRRGDDYEIARAVPTPSLAEQLGVNTTSQSARGPADKAAPAGGAPARLTSRSGRAGFGKKLGEAPPDLLSIGVVDSISSPPAVAKSASPTEPAPVASATTDGGPPRKSSRARGGRKKAEASDAAGSDARSGRATRARGGKGRKSAAEKAATPEPDPSVV